jgi:predicted dehydrogenase
MSKRLHRRDLLKSTAAAAVDVGYWTTTSKVRAESPNEKLDIVCIGIGGRGGANVGGVSSQNIIGLCDVDERTGGGSFKRFPKAHKFQDYRKMLDKMEKQIDAVVVSTPDHTHFHPSIKAMQMGKHLYCEKPMAHSVWECRKMTELAKKMKIATQLGVQRHTITNMHRVVELIQAGAIGQVKEVHSWIGGSRGMPGKPTKFPAGPAHLNWDLWLGPVAMRPYSPDYCPYKWRFWWDFGTGETGNWGCHILDIPFWALGLKYPTRVDASGPEIDADRTPKAMTTSLKFPADGKRAAMTLHWYHSAGTPPIAKKLGVKTGGANNIFVGEKGVLVCGFGSRKLYPEEKFKDYEAPAKTIPNSPGFYKEWFTAIKGGQPATCNFDYSGPMAETVLLANTAYRAGGGFDWDAKNMKATGNDKAHQYLVPVFRKGWEVDI